MYMYLRLLRVVQYCCYLQLDTSCCQSAPRVCTVIEGCKRGRNQRQSSFNFFAPLPSTFVSQNLKLKFRLHGSNVSIFFMAEIAKIARLRCSDRQKNQRIYPVLRHQRFVFRTRIKSIHHRLPIHVGQHFLNTLHVHVDYLFVFK